MVADPAQDGKKQRGVLTSSQNRGSVAWRLADRQGESDPHCWNTIGTDTRVPLSDFRQLEVTLSCSRCLIPRHHLDTGSVEVRGSNPLSSTMMSRG